MDKFNNEINVEYLKRTATLVQNAKLLSYDLLKLGSSQRILDAGCGPGVDTIAIAKLLDDNSSIIGVDVSAEMIKSADEYKSKEKLSHKIKHIQASIDSLPFEDNYFDGVRAERLFQVISNDVIKPEKIFNELYRVLKKDGRMVLADTDWATASVDFSCIETERKLIRFFSDVCRPNGYAGRTFQRLMKEANMENIQTYVIPIVMTRFDDENPLANWLYREAKINKVVSDEKLELWMYELSEKSEKNTFFAVANINIVVGIKG